MKLRSGTLVTQIQIQVYTSVSPRLPPNFFSLLSLANIMLNCIYNTEKVDFNLAVKNTSRYSLQSSSKEDF